MKVTLVRADSHSREELDFEYQSNDSADGKRPMVLDILLQAETEAMPDLAYRYGCRNALCGVCTVDVNGTSRLACRTKAREGDRISAVSGLPVLRDLVVRRDAINRQLLGRIPAPGSAVQAEMGADDEAYLSLNRCIECYACLDDCPLHAKNDLAAGEFHSGNPFSFLKLQKVIVDGAASEPDRTAVQSTAMELGLKTCANCKGCRCGVGIDLKAEVIQPLLQANALIVKGSHWDPDSKPQRRR